MQYGIPLRMRQLLLTAVAAAICGTGIAAEKARPDFSGIWTIYRDPAAPTGRTGGFGGPSANLPFTPEGKARTDEYMKLLGPENANAASYCVDYGMPSMMEQAGGYPIEFIQRPEQLTIVYEVEGELRRVFLAGQTIPEEKRLASRQGYSIGHWEGDTLVVKTTDLMDGQDQRTHPHSEEATIEERFSLGKDAKGVKVMSYEMTLTDPVYYTKPVGVKKKFTPLVNGFIFTYRCPDEFWLALLEKRREQLKAGKPANAKMSDIYKDREAYE